MAAPFNKDTSQAGSCQPVQAPCLFLCMWYNAPAKSGSAGKQGQCLECIISRKLAWGKFRNLSLSTVQ